MRACCHIVLEVTDQTTFHAISQFTDQVDIDVIQPHGCPQSCLTHTIERRLEVNEDIIKALLVLKVFLTEYSKIAQLCSFLL